MPRITRDPRGVSYRWTSVPSDGKEEMETSDCHLYAEGSGAYRSTIPSSPPLRCVG